MNAFNRVFLALLALLWIAAWAGVTYIMWDAESGLEVSNRYLEFLFDVSVSGSDRILATLIAVGAMVLGLALLAAQLIPAGRGRPAVAAAEGDARFRELRERLDHLQRRVDARDAGPRPVAPDRPAPDTHPRRWGLLGRDRR